MLDLVPAVRGLILMGHSVKLVKGRMVMMVRWPGILALAADLHVQKRQYPIA